jgi:hypothetical protein
MSGPLMSGSLMSGSLTWGPLLWVGAVVLWLAAFYVVGVDTWGHGPQTFAVLSALGLGMVAVPWATNRARRRWGVPPTEAGPTGLVPLGVVALVVVLGLGALHVSDLGSKLGSEEYRNKGLDIGINTRVAGEHFARGDNPYRKRSQVLYQISAGEDVTVTDGLVEMFGVPYSYGYPYFPAMFLTFAPFQWAQSGLHSIRLGNGLVLAMCLLAMGLLIPRLVPNRRLALVGTLLSATTLLGAGALRTELYTAVVTDLAIGMWALLGYAALAWKRPGWSGVFFGVTLACKLLPGPLLVVPAVIWMWRRPGWGALVLGTVAGAGAILAPYLIWDAERLLSSTILFYMVNHAGGDDTSLWFALPAVIQPWFQAAGLVLVAGTVAAAVPARRGSLLAPLTVGFLAYLAFIAFNRMTHLNYLWGIYPLGCVALVLGMMRATLGRGLLTQQPPPTLESASSQSVQSAT